jgi:thiamine-phosphate diphosphorylase
MAPGALISGIYVITDESLVPGRTHAEIAAAALAGGAKIIQLRDKNACEARMAAIGKEIRLITRWAEALFIVNDSLEVALECDADGLHVGQGDRSAAEIRDRLPGKILGVSVTTVDEAAQAARAGADYIGVGPIFPTETKADAGKALGVDTIRGLRDASNGLPTVAIGGINAGNLALVARSGANSAAVISAIVCAPDMTEATRDLIQTWEYSRR